ncbi:MAG: tRNA (cytidine(56)-2'-O)-methyltransferase [Nitrososphaeria archaeon]
MQEEIFVLRIGHRIDRDKRITTHVGLVARAFGARGIYIVNAEKEIKSKIDEVTKVWGGPFICEIIEDNWKKFILDWKKKEGIIIHLTMYGIPVEDRINEIRLRKEKKLVVVGAEKVPKELYYLSDYNISITTQPHSEVAALALFLDRFYEGKELSLKFSNAKLKIVPMERGKRVIESRI